MFGVELPDVVKVEVVQVNTRRDGARSVVTDFTLRLWASNGEHADWADAYHSGNELTLASFTAFVAAVNRTLGR